MTGSSQGTGAAVAQLLREHGAAVWTTARSLPSDLPEPEHFIAANISTADGTDRLAERILGEGGIDILIHVAGGSSSPNGGFAALDDDHWLAELQLNLLGAVRLDRALVPGMIGRQSGAIVHVARSIFGAKAVTACLAPLKLTARGSMPLTSAATAMTVRSRL